ncbi:MAG: endolytic transglycosylase MltG [Hahellaceae bacterium]|nr:endolytic transglycosylase MltG [Hahellaceae bacterium]
MLKRITWLSGLLILAALGTIQYLLASFKQPLVYTNPVTLELAQGDNLSIVVAKLQDAGVIESARLASLLGRYYDYDRRLKVGEYELPTGLSLYDIFELLSSGRAVQYGIRLLEGWRIKEIRDEVGRHPKLVAEIQSWDPEALAAELGLDVANAEGQFFPDTYFYHKGMSDKQILLAANTRLKGVLETAWQSKTAEAVVGSPYEALILASIVEKETGKAEERDLISGVFNLRLAKGMKLQTDPTVIYGMGDAYQGKIRRKHLLEATPYNTYVIPGLPPTPIALSSEAAIQAAVKPRIEGYLYFVAKGDGSHVFSKTLEEHNEAVKAYQLKRKADYRSH